MIKIEDQGAWDLAMEYTREWLCEGCKGAVRGCEQDDTVGCDDFMKETEKEYKAIMEEKTKNVYGQ